MMASTTKKAYKSIIRYTKTMHRRQIIINHIYDRQNTYVTTTIILTDNSSKQMSSIPPNEESPAS